MKRWTGPIPSHDDFNDPINGVFVDGKTIMGPWAIMTPRSFRLYGIGKLGTGFGQKYVKAASGFWVKVSTELAD